MKKQYEPLFQPYTLNNGVVLKNRLVVAPLTIYDAGDNGELTPAARRFWQNRFEGFGLFVAPFTNVHPSGVGFPSPHAFSEAHLPTLRKYVHIAHSQGAKAVVQLAHAGLRSEGRDVLAPSGDPFGRFRAMTSDEVAEMVQSFAYAAELALRAGFDGVEIHGANGWLIQQFVSAQTNRRTDEWGGSLEKRLRFPLAIVDAMDEVRQRHQRPDFIIGYRFSPEEPGEQGLTMHDTLALVDALCQKPLQYLHVSLWDFYKKARRGGDDEYRMKLIHERIAGRLPLIGVGNLYTGDDMLRAWQAGWAEFIALGKSVMLNPNLVELLTGGRDNEIQTHFDWNNADFYRYTPAMLHGTRLGMDFYPPSKNKR